MIVAGSTQFFLTERELNVVLHALRACVTATKKADLRIVLNDVVMRLETTREIRDETAKEKQRIRQRAYTQRRRMKLRELEKALSVKSNGTNSGG